MSVLPEHWADPVARALAAAGTHTQYELKSDERTFTVSALPLAEPEGTAVLVFEDQTAKRVLQEQLIQSEKMSAIGQLIAGVAHDLNNPLASVVGFADYLVEEGDPPDAMRHPLEAIRQEAERAASIVRNLLNFARKQEGLRRSQPIRPILDAIIGLLHNQLMTSKVEMTLEVDDDLPYVDVDANQIQQVFVNLISNAAQAIHSSGVGSRIGVHVTAGSPTRRLRTAERRSAWSCREAPRAIPPASTRRRRPGRSRFSSWTTSPTSSTTCG
jgi:signal transduction histidine kinase